MNAKEIYNKRIEFAQKLISRDSFSLNVNSKYFEIPRSVAIKTLSEMGISDYKTVESSNPLPLKALVAKRNEILKREGDSLESLHSLGFWYKPSEIIATFETALDAAINYYKTERGTGEYGTTVKAMQHNLKDDGYKISSKFITENVIQRGCQCIVN